MPPVTIDAPQRQARPRRHYLHDAHRPRAQPQRNRAARAPQAPAAPSPSANAQTVERADGPVNGFVATRSATGTKTDTPIVEVPQSISVVPKDQIIAQGAQSISQALRYTAGVFAEPNGAADFSSTFLKLRGFRTDLYLDGLRLPNSPSSAVYSEAEPYGVERIDVLNGAVFGTLQLKRSGRPR